MWSSPQSDDMCLHANFLVSRSKDLSEVPFLVYFALHVHEKKCGQMAQKILDKKKNKKKNSPHRTEGWVSLVWCHGDRVDTQTIHTCKLFLFQHAKSWSSACPK